MPTLSGIDTVLRQGAGALGIFLEQLMSVVMEVANDRNVDALLVELLDDGCDGGSSLFVVDRDPNQFRARTGQRRNLLDGRGNVRGIRVRHGLHHNRCIAAHANPIDRASDGFSSLNISHVHLV